MIYTVWQLTRPDESVGVYSGQRRPFPQAYRAAGTIEAGSLDAAFAAGQNDSTLGGRNRAHAGPSVSVGDVLVDADGHGWEVAPIGWIVRRFPNPSEVV